MLKVIVESAKKRAGQEELKRNLVSTLEDEGKRSIGFQGGNIYARVYAAGRGELWVAFRGPTKIHGVRRYWNVFGVYQPDRPAQSITVEINIPTETNARVAGFFAEDTETGELFLMHSGRVGGGRPGIGKSAFLVRSKAKLIEVSGKDGGLRSGIVIGKLKDPDLADRIWRFVRSVQVFKDQAGDIQTPEFKEQIEEFNRYNKEFAGMKRGVRGGAFEYISYHGDIVQKLYEERTARLFPGEKVLNSNLIDLYVKRNGVLSEIYEIKTGVGRQMLYTAIGQMVTHAASGGGQVAKYLVVPAEETIPTDLRQAIAVLGIQVRRFRLQKNGPNRIIELD
jgi:hypothetical protein